YVHASLYAFCILFNFEFEFYWLIVYVFVVSVVSVFYTLSLHDALPISAGNPIRVRTVASRARTRTIPSASPAAREAAETEPAGAAGHHRIRASRRWASKDSRAARPARVARAGKAAPWASPRHRTSRDKRAPAPAGLSARAAPATRRRSGSSRAGCAP